MSEYTSETNGYKHINGRFAPGTRGGPGNPQNVRLRELRRSVIDATTPEDVKAVIGKLLELAKAGDVQAARVWLEYVIGKPAQSLEVSGLDGSSLELSAVVGVILASLGDDEAARVRVAAAFHRLGSGHGPDATGMGS